MPDRVERHCPREQEGDFQIENNEQNGDQVVADIKLGARVFEGLETALIGREFRGVLTTLADQEAQPEQQQTDACRDAKEDQNGKVLL